MAIDTRDRRMSMIGLAKPFVRLFQNPAGTISAVGRAMAEFLYAGIGLGEPAVATPRIVYLTASRANHPALTASRSNRPSLTASR